MTLSTFKVEPAGNGAGGDVTFSTSNPSTDAIVIPATNNKLRAGSTSSKSGTFSRGLMFRYEISGTIKPRATINGVRWTFYDRASGGGLSADFRCGVIKDDGDWTTSLGFKDASYVQIGDLPRANTPTEVDTVFYGDNAHDFSFFPFDLSVNDPFSIATGNLTGDINLPALLSDVQGSFDDVKAAIAFQISDDQASNIGDLDFSDGFFSDGDFAPTLEIDWTPRRIIIV